MKAKKRKLMRNWAQRPAVGETIVRLVAPDGTTQTYRASSLTMKFENRVDRPGGLPVMAKPGSARMISVTVRVLQALRPFEIPVWFEVEK